MSPVVKLSLPQLQSDLHTVLSNWHKDDTTSPLVHYRLFRIHQQENAGQAREVCNRIVLQALQTLAAHHPKDAELLRLRFLDHQLVQTLTAKRNVSESKLHADQRRAIARLAEVVADQEHQAHQTRRRAFEQRLEAPIYNQLVGLDGHVATLLFHLATPIAPWLIALHGLGGIGKTSLADALVRQALNDERWEAIAWVSARRETFNLSGQIELATHPPPTAHGLIQRLARQVLGRDDVASLGTDAHILSLLERRLHECPHLVVIDNLETLEDGQWLVPILRRLTNPTKFVLTTRESLYTEQDVFHFPVRELSQTDALRLLRQEAKLRNLPHLFNCSDAELQPIFELVGGNPLALRLVAGQTRLYALDAILNDLIAAQTDAIDQFYTFVYRRAWENLSELSRQVLLSMLSTPPQGGDLNFLSGVSQLGQTELCRGLDMLLTLNLVDSRGTLHERRYSIHGLTRAFLQNQVAKWQ